MTADEADHPGAAVGPSKNDTCRSIRGADGQVLREQAPRAVVLVVIADVLIVVLLAMAGLGGLFAMLERIGRG